MRPHKHWEQNHLYRIRLPAQSLMCVLFSNGKRIFPWDSFGKFSTRNQSRRQLHQPILHTPESSPYRHWAKWWCKKTLSLLFKFGLSLFWCRATSSPAPPPFPTAWREKANQTVIFRCAKHPPSPRFKTWNAPAEFPQSFSMTMPQSHLSGRETSSRRQESGSARPPVYRVRFQEHRVRPRGLKI